MVSFLLRFQHPETEPKNMPPTDHLQIAMAACHSLTMIDGELSGDPLDLIMFNSVNWVSSALSVSIIPFMCY